MCSYDYLSSFALVVGAALPPKGSGAVITEQLENRTVTAGRDIRLDCPVQGKPVPRIVWFFNNKALPSSLTQFPNGSVLLAAVGDWWAGVWTCSAANKHGKDKQEFALTINSKLSG